MSTYSTNDYHLQTSSDFQDLDVIDSSTNLIETTYSLSSGIKISVSGGDYDIVADSCDTCFANEFDSGEDDTISFDNAKMIGVTVVRIECKQHEFTYHLDECAVYLKNQGTKLVVKSPADTSGTAPCPECVDEVVTPLTVPCT